MIDPEKTNLLTSEHIASLADEMAHVKANISRENMENIFSEMTPMEYSIITALCKRMGLHKPDEKIYLSEIAEEMNIPIQQVSKLAGTLSDRGIVIWKHDGRGENGTYIILSDSGKELYARQRKLLHRYYISVMSKLGEERFVEILSAMKELEKAMNQAASEITTSTDDF